MDALIIRRALVDEADEVATVYIESRRAASAYLPTVGTDAEIREFVTGTMVPSKETWVAEIDGRIAAVMVMDRDMLEQLYVAPAMQNRGIGARMLARAKHLSPTGLRLHTFQRNAPARRFYEKRGFAAIAFTDGATNMEREPDVLYEWAP